MSEESPRSSRQHAGFKTAGELLFASYGNLGMAREAVERGIAKYDTLSYMVRARLTKGLRTGKMQLSSLFADAREFPADRCAYCAARPPPKLHGDHLIARHRGGLESADNLVWACRSCNSRKGAKDLLVWYEERGAFPPLALIQRYLKLAIAEARAANLIDVPLEVRPEVTFELAYIPTRFPAPAELVWMVE